MATTNIAVPTQGVRADLTPTEVPPEALRDAENWLRREGRFRVRPGFANFGTNVGQRPTAMIQYLHHDLNTRLVLGTTEAWWRYNAGTGAWVDISGGAALTASPSQQQVFRTFSKAGETWLLGVNGKDAPKKWNGVTAAYTNIGGSPPIARCMMVVGDRIILGNLSSGGTMSPMALDVSNLTDFDSGWGSVLVKILGEIPGEIIAMQEMGYLQGVIYTDQAIALAIQQDGTIPFRFEFRPRVIGPASTQSVAAIAEGTHAYLGLDGAVYLFDGTQPRSLGPQIQKHIDKVITTDRLARSWVAWDKAQQFLWVVYTAVGGAEPSRGVVIAFPDLQCYPVRWTAIQPTCGQYISLPTGLTIGDLTVPIGDITATLGEMDTTAPRFALGALTGQCSQDTGLTDAGSAIPHFMELGLRRIGQRFGTITDVEHFFKKSGGAQKIGIRLGGSDYGEERYLEPDATGTENEIELANGGPYSTGHRFSSQYLTMRMEGNASQLVEWEGSDVTAAGRGFR